MQKPDVPNTKAAKVRLDAAADRVLAELRALMAEDIPYP